MLLKFNRDSELEIVGLGVFRPNEIIDIKDKLKVEKYIATGYFDVVREEKKKKVKSKKKGDDK